MTEIAWRPWGEEVFAEAQQQNKPVFLSLYATWCRFCRTMDQQTYGNDAIAQYVNEQFIPVRVDTDKRPDVNTRYSQGGWPSTCLLTPEGDVLWGGTFVPADQMAQMLPQVLNEFRNNKAGVSQHVARMREQVRAQNTPPALDTNLPISADITRIVLLNAKHNFDLAFGGFGHNGQKFPHVEALELLLEQYSASVRAGSPDSELRLMLDKSLAGVADGSLQDKEGLGGFFRYTQTVDWRDPQVEKMLEDSALLARTFSRAYQLLGDERYLATATRTIGYLDDTLYDSERGTWGGSQYADAEYYAQPIAERSEWNPPTVDPTVLAGPTAQAVRAHVAYWAATGDEGSLAKAQRGLDFVLANLLQPDGALTHFVPNTDEDAAAAGRTPTGLLADAADVTAACLDLYEAGRGADYLDRAETIAVWVRGHLEDPRGGGLFDAVVRPDAVGNLKIGTKDVPDNMQMADALLRLFLATGEEEHARLAQRTMQAFLPVLPQIGFLASGFALAAERSLLQPILVHVVGPSGSAQTTALIAAAHKPYRFERLVQPLDPANPDDAEHIESLGYAASAEPTAYVCVGAVCQAPITDPAKLGEAIETAK
jgi:uncharacterized protein YyaL (SSP411 family)